MWCCVVRGWVFVFVFVFALVGCLETTIGCLEITSVACLRLQNKAEQRVHQNCPDPEMTQRNDCTACAADTETSSVFFFFRRRRERPEYHRKEKKSRNSKILNKQHDKTRLEKNEGAAP